MRRLTGLSPSLLVLCLAGAALAQPAEDDVDTGIPESVKKARESLEKAAKAEAAKAEADAKAKAAADGEPKAAGEGDAKAEGDAKPSKGAPKAVTNPKPAGDPKPVDLSKTTVKGANWQDKVQAAAEAEKRRLAAEQAGNPDTELPDWAPAPDAIKPVDHSGQVLDSTQEWTAASSTSVGYPLLEHHGYFRMRLDLFHNLDLDTWRAGNGGSSPVLPPLTEIDQQGSLHPETPEHRYGRGADTLAGANLRLRYQPTLHVNENLRVHATLDILDNLVLGSTPDGGRPDAALEMFSETQVPPTAGVNGYQNSVQAKRVWGEWRNLVGLTQFGRMPHDWGLGMIANSGDCLDCNFGDVVDRISHTVELFDTYLTVAWDFPSEGFTGFAGEHDALNQRLGQAHDFEQRDDVNQWIIAIFDKPMTKREIETRLDDLNRRRQFVWDWGVYNIIRNQPFSSTSTSSVPPTSAGQVQLLDVKGFTYTPDLWLNFEYRPRKRVGYKLQIEAAAVFGVIEEIPDSSFATQPITECADPSAPDIERCGDTFEPRRREITQWGGALEFDARNEQLEWGLHAGAASGDSAGFGILDRSPITGSRRDSAINNFRFDRDYIVDLILFREIIGGVTNATYFKPYLAYNFVDEDTPEGLRKEKWGFKLSGMYAQALVADGTPGEKAPLGLEFDLELYMHELNVFKWSVAYGILFPLSGFEHEVTEANQSTRILQPNTAQTLQMNLGFQF